MAGVRIRLIALPTEHGGWGFLFEAILLGLLVAPSAAGGFMSLAAISCFLLRHPLKLALTGTGGLLASPRRRLALAFTLGYGLVAAAGFAIAVLRAGPRVLVPLAIGSPLLVLFLVYDARKRSREFAAEIAAPLGLAVTAPTVALCADWPAMQGAVLWGLLAARSVPSIIYVRAKLRRLRGEKVRRPAVVALHLLLAGVAAMLALLALIPVLAAVAILGLAVRATIGLYEPRRTVRATRIGILEIVYGLLFVILVSAGYRSGI